ncbi:helix-turn-helix domain-containing protein [Methylolobus aquaticus]
MKIHNNPHTATALGADQDACGLDEVTHSTLADEGQSVDRPDHQAPATTPYGESALGRVQDAINYDALPDSVLLKETQAAAFLDLAPGTMSVWRCTGRESIPYLKVGRNVRYRLGDLRRWLNKRIHRHCGASGPAPEVGVEDHGPPPRVKRQTKPGIAGDGANGLRRKDRHGTKGQAGAAVEPKSNVTKPAEKDAAPPPSRNGRKGGDDHGR